MEEKKLNILAQPLKLNPRNSPWSFLCQVQCGFLRECNCPWRILVSKAGRGKNRPCPGQAGPLIVALPRTERPCESESRSQQIPVWTTATVVCGAAFEENPEASLGAECSNLANGWCLSSQVHYTDIMPKQLAVSHFCEMRRAKLTESTKTHLYHRRASLWKLDQLPYC